MPILGLVLTLNDDKLSTRAQVAAALPGMPSVEAGEPAGHRWPVVLEARSECQAEAHIEGLRSLSGISGVDVVYADFEDLLPCSPRAGGPEDS